MKKEKRGVLLIALGHPNYGCMAYNLAVSLLNTAPDLKIHLMFNPMAVTHLNADQLNVFSSMREAPEDSYYRKGNCEFIKAKTRVYDFSPFDTTIFLDVDMIWLTQKSINTLFDELAETDYTIQNRDFVDLSEKKSFADYSQWANVEEIKAAYNFKKGNYYSLHSEFIYFKKTKENKTFFNEWKNQYDELKVKCVVFGNGIPDELPLSIASVICERYPHKDAYLPIYWERAEKPMERTELIESYYGFSIGGNRITPVQVSTYDDFVKYYMNKIGSSIVFKTQSKVSFLTERQNF